MMSRSKATRSRSAALLRQGGGPFVWVAATAGAVLSVAIAAGASAAPIHGPGDEVLPFTWDGRAVEHVWNRAGFGVHGDEINRWVEAGPQALVDHLLAPRPLLSPDGEPQEVLPPFGFTPARVDPLEYELRTLDERREYRRIAAAENAAAFRGFRGRWIEQIAAGDDPLRDRMCLFWHGVFTSSYTVVRHPSPIIEQHDVLRAGALGSYDALLRAMLRDVALLKYLDGDKNRKGRPNENLAREVMELFSLGEGNYGEDDIREAARALTGAGVVTRFDGGQYRYFPKRHDSGDKTILGVSGEHRPDDLPDILLAQPACARFVASSLIEYLEGVPPSEERIDSYAETLRATDYDISFILRRLLLDPAFYRDEVIGARVASPVDYLMGTAVRLGERLPPEFVVQAAAVLGEDLFQPPNVKGWESGLHWMTTARFMLRGNVAGAVLGRISGEGLRSDALGFVDEMAMGDEMQGMSSADAKTMGAEQLRRDELSPLVRILERARFESAVSLVRTVRADGARTDVDVVRSLTGRLLAIECPVETLRMLEGRLAALRGRVGLEPQRLAQSRSLAEPILRELGHLILSLPEAQLH